MALSPVRLRASMSVGSADTIAFTRSNSPALIASMKAALLEVVSGMHRFYPVWVVLALACCGSVNAQTPAAAGEQQTPASQQRPPLGAWFTVEPLGGLPLAGSLFPLLSTVAEVIPDRIDSGGLSAGSPAREGAHGETWTQTTYRVGDADVTNSSGTGTPLLMPGIDVWERVDVTTGMMPIDVGAPGMAVALTPRRPAVSLMRTVEAFVSPPLVNAGSATTVPPSLNRLNAHARANLFISGPLGD